MDQSDCNSCSTTSSSAAESVQEQQSCTGFVPREICIPSSEDDNNTDTLARSNNNNHDDHDHDNESDHEDSSDFLLKVIMERYQHPISSAGTLSGDADASEGNTKVAHREEEKEEEEAEAEAPPQEKEKVDEDEIKVTEMMTLEEKLPIVRGPMARAAAAARRTAASSGTREDAISIAKRPYITSDNHRVKVPGLEQTNLGAPNQFMFPGAYAVHVGTTGGTTPSSPPVSCNQATMSSEQTASQGADGEQNQEDGSQCNSAAAAAASLVGCRAQQEEPSEHSSNRSFAAAPAPAGGVVEDAILVHSTHMTLQKQQLEAPVDIEKGRAPTEEVIEGKILEEEQKKKPLQPDPSHPQWGLVLVAAIVLIGALAILLTIFLTSSSSQEKSTAENDASMAGPTLYPPYSDDLSGEIINGIGRIDSSYYKANEWMVKDPNLNTYTPQRQKQRFLMAYFYFQSNGDQWFQNDHWLSYDVSECQWFCHNSSLDVSGWNPGMEPEPVCDDNGNLLVMNLTANNLNGISPVQTDGISNHLVIFDVSDNNIQGPMPPVAAHAKNMEVFIMSNNQLKGQITGGHGMSAFQQRIVKLDGNQLLGHFPLICTILPDLEFIDTTGNKFDQDLLHFKDCKKMKHLIASDNLFKGSIPSQFGLMTSLIELVLSKNALTGTIPEELSQLTDLKLFDITETNIQGPVPEELCERTNQDLLDVIANCSSVQCCQ